eukprot:11134419-Prorocentrum_lima.AAC.1
MFFSPVLTSSPGFGGGHARAINSSTGGDQGYSSYCTGSISLAGCLPPNLVRQPTRGLSSPVAI